MPEITPSSRVPFRRGPNKGKRVKDCDDATLIWMTSNYTVTDFHMYAVAARQVLDARAAGEASMQAEADLETQADEFLRRHGAGYLARRRR